MNIDVIADQAWKTADEKGWHDEPRSFGDLVALGHTEFSESLEAFRERAYEKWTREDGKPEGVMAELADVVIRVMDTVEGLRRMGLVQQTLGEAVIEKMLFNSTRPHRHGGKRL